MSEGKNTRKLQMDENHKAIHIHTSIKKDIHLH